MIYFNIFQPFIYKFSEPPAQNLPHPDGARVSWRLTCQPLLTPASFAGPFPDRSPKTSVPPDASDAV